MGTPTGAANATTEGKCSLIVYNYCLYPSPPSKMEVILDNTDTYSSLHSQVAQKTGYPSEAFELYFGSKKTPFQDSDAEKTLAELNFPTGKCMLQLRRKSGSKDSDFNTESSKKVSSPAIKSTPTLTLGGGGGGAPSYSNALVPIGPVTEAGAAAGYRHSYGSSSSVDWNKKSKTGYVGLSNQGATCYMNSLIQTLYMTPEFRAALYKWSFEETWKKRERERKEKLVAEGKMEVENDPTEEERKKEYEKDSIPRQLQLLFARLQLREIRAVKTKNLTNSFGWKESDAFTQHDVQELCRVLFDALEKVFKGTEQETLINDLYQGEMKDYVRCKVCDHESLRTDKYLDIPLVIRGFGSTTAIKSVEEALSKFVQPELLYGDNQYKCSKCNINVDATKGLKFTSFPYLLTLQLKRFDFDYNTFRRIKLNDLVTFPNVLNLNGFLEDSDTKQTTTTTSPKRKLADESPVSGEPMEIDLNNEDTQDEQEQAQNHTINNNNNKKEEEDSAKGPYQYELYSVLIHRGSALGGHYYAYIKSFEQNKWFEFNDSTVTEINEEDIKKSFGDEDRPKGYAQYYHSSANAYMLMYRRIDPSKNVIAVTNEDVPKELVNYIQLENDKRKKKQEEKEKEREMVKLRVFYEGVEKEVKLHQTTTIAEATSKCAQAFDLRNDPTCIRLRNYQAYTSMPQEPYDSEEISSKSLENLNFYSGKTVTIETRDPSESFPHYNPQDMNLRVFLYDPEESKFSDGKTIYIDKDARLKDLRKIIAQKFKIPEGKQRILREAMGYGVMSSKILVGDDELLRLEHRVFEGYKIYLEYSDDPESSDSPAATEIERIKNDIDVKFIVIGKEETYSLTVSKKMLFGEFKKRVSSMISIPVDEFRVSRGTMNWKIEVKNEKETLEECKISEYSKLIIEKGKPLKEGESILKFHLFDPLNKRGKEAFEEVFESSVTEEMTIVDLKQKLVQQLKSEKNIEIEPKKLRLREMYSKTPSKIYKDKNTMKDSSNVIYSGKSLAMQELDHEEDVKEDWDIAIFIQQWFPSKYEVGAKIELTLDERQPVSALKNLLCEKYGIKNIGIAKVMGSWPGPDLLDIPDLYWNKEIPEWQGEGKSGSIGHTPYYLRDGDVLMFKDNDEIEKELTKEEKAKMEKEANIKKRPTYYAKEEALHINAKV